jgi:fibronectin-binding autotransporter adhesin
LGNTAGGGTATTLTVGGNSVSTTFGGVISDGAGINTNAVGNLTKTGTGTLTLTGANTYTGATTVSNGTLAAGVDNALGGTTAITVQSGGTLLLSGGATSNRINNAATVALNAGATFNSGGLSEGTRPTGPAGSGGVAGMGALTLSGTSGSPVTINFGTNVNGSTLDFSSLSAASKGTFVNILAWDGTAGGGASRAC